MMLDASRVEETRDLLGAEVFAKFLQRLEGEMDEFISWQSSEQPPEAQDIELKCHTLASSAGLYGASELRIALLAAEQAAKSSDPTELAAATRSLADIWHSTKRALKELG